LLLPLALCLVPACKCGPNNPTPVTLRIKNTSHDPIWVDDTDGRSGVVVQRNVGGTWFSFIESPGCGQPACTNACTVQSCDAGTSPRVQRVSANDNLERTWSGVVQVDGQASC